MTTGTHPIAARDVHIGENKNKILFVLRTSKTHWKDVDPQTVKICSTQSNNKNNKTNKLCPYSLLREYLKIRKPYKTNHEPFFVFADRSPVTSNAKRIVFKKILQLENFDTEVYNLHSFRIGRACDLLKGGIPVEVIKKLGRWKSNIVYKYLR